MTFADLFSGIGGFRIALERVGMHCVKSCEIDRFCRSIYKKNFGAGPEVEDIREWQSTSSQRDFPVKTSVSPASAPDLQEIEAGYSGSLCEFWNSNAPAGFSLRMFPDFCLPTEAEISPSFCIPWTGSGMAWRGEYLMLDTSNSPNNAVECGLSDILEDPVPSRFYLSPKAARGILRRAEKRGRTLPMPLERALRHLADMTPTVKPTSLEPSAADQASLTLPANPHVTQKCLSSTKTSVGSQPQPITPGHCEAGPATVINSSPMLSEVEAIPTAMPQGAAAKTTSTLSVRRLTPTECERLQGFPDNWTRLTDRATRCSVTQSRFRLSNGSVGA